MIKEKDKLIEMSDSASEVEYFLVILNCDDSYWMLMDGIKNGTIERTPIVDEDVRDIDEIKQVYLGKMLRRYGIDPLTASNRDGDYWKWYDFYLSWYGSLTNDVRDIIKYKAKNGMNFSDYCPVFRWNGSVI